MGLKNDLKQLTLPYYIGNIVLSLSYIIAKKLPYVCSNAFPRSESVCEFDSRESEILFFLLIVVMIRTRKAGSTTMVSYLTSSFMYNKVANAILWFYADLTLGIIYIIVSIVFGVFCPEPVYSGPENITYFRGLQALEDELKRNKRVAWVVVFYTMWNPACNNLAPIFAHLSADYHTDNLRFGKIDLGRFPEAGKKYHVNDSAVSKQLPTIILFEEGKERIRKPDADSTGRLNKFFFSEDNIRVSFDLNNVYEKCKKSVKIVDGKKKQ